MKKSIVVLLLMGIAAICILIEGCGPPKCEGYYQCDDYESGINCEKLCLTRTVDETGGLCGGIVCSSKDWDNDPSTPAKCQANPPYASYTTDCCRSCSNPS